MILDAVTEVIPVQTDASGVRRIGKTRVTLDTVVAVFKGGATAEEIVQRYPSLELGDVYSVIGYYLHQQVEVESYLHQRSLLAATIRQQNETRFNPNGVRARLLARPRI
jgi:uncharacterized protein (DUF433 family)